MHAKFNKDTLLSYLIFNKPIKYSEHITLYPVTMNDILIFQVLSQSIVLRKNSTFHDKKIIKMSYLDFLIYCFGAAELEEQYKIVGLSNYYSFAMQLLMICCKTTQISIDPQTKYFYINDELITPQIFDDLRRIIIVQNDIDFDIDEFLNYDTEQRLLKAQKSQEKDGAKASIEDYIDSLVIAMKTTEEHVMNMTIRKFWRYMKRYQLQENYTIAKTGECSGFVKFKEPIEYWMTSLDQNDRYKNLKTDENSLRSKISG